MGYLAAGLAESTNPIPQRLSCLMSSFRMSVLMLVMVMIVRMLCASLAIHPARITVHVMFFFPNRNAMFYFVDDVAAGFEGFVAMARAYADPNGDIANR